MSKTTGPIPISHRRNIDSLHKALDQTYRNLLDAAKADWQQLFGDDELDETCISVRVSNERIADELAGFPALGLRPTRRPNGLKGKRRKSVA